MKCGQVELYSRMKAAITINNHVSNRAKAAQFMQSLAGFIENPVRC